MASSLLSRARQNNYFLLELYIFLRALGQSVASISLSLLIQDKICVDRYNQTQDFCQHINEPMKSIVEQNTKNHILAESTQFANYKNFLECIPMLLWSLFIGSFLDNYSGGTRLVLLFGVFGDLIALCTCVLNVYFYDSSLYYLLIGSVNVWFTGGMTSFLTAVYSYIAINSDEHLRPIKFMLVRFSNIMGKSLGTLIGGHLIVVTQRNANPQLRTYYRNFVLSMGLDVLLIGILWSLFRVAKQSKSSILESTNTENVEKLQLIDSSSANKPFNKFIRVFFNLDNVRQTFACFIKTRDGRTRMQIHLLYLVLFAKVLTFYGVEDVLLQFCEKVYNWDAKMYSNLASLSKIFSIVMLAISSIFLVEKWKLSDGMIVWWALVSSFFSNLIVGTFLSPVSFYVSVPVGALSGFSLISIRSKLSKLVSTDEIGKILSLSSTLEAVIPFFSSLIYSSLFAFSIATYPSFVYHFSSFIVLLSLVVMIFEEFY